MSVDRFILTGPPGAGKTTILRQLAQEGFPTADEAATDVIAEWRQQGIAEAWTHPSFIDAIVETQRLRQLDLGDSAKIQFYDRSPICTLALAKWLGYPVSDPLRFEIARIRREKLYRPEVFFVRSLGFMTPTEARRLNLADSLRFGDLHEAVYLAHGFQLIHIDPAPAAQRVDSIKRYVAACRETNLPIRLATLHDVPALESLIAHSVRILQAPDYTPAQREGALGTVFGVDRRLILDGTYFVAEASSALVACGGWSRRKTLFGSDHSPVADTAWLDPASEPARIRAFFVHPQWARRGLATRILEACETAARAAGFTSLELAATLTGVPLYQARGFLPIERFDFPLSNGVTLPLVRMSRPIRPLTPDP